MSEDKEKQKTRAEEPSLKAGGSEAPTASATLIEQIIGQHFCSDSVRSAIAKAGIILPSSATKLPFGVGMSSAHGVLAATKPSLDLQEEIADMRKELRKNSDALKEKALDAKKKDQKISELESHLGELRKKEELAFLLESVTNSAHERLFESASLRDQFFDGAEKSAFVVSVDIRRSTELMLKARSPSAFSDFITTLCDGLVSIFKANYGVVDKFTGDGILAFFPEFFSGNDAGYFALNACSDAIDIFEKCYYNSRKNFSTVLKDVGIGIGVDYGPVHLLQMAGSLTVVGQPVVYACRLGGAPPGSIYFNQPAFEKISASYAHVTNTVEAELNLKHEGRVLCYDISLTTKGYEPELPSWYQESEQEAATEQPAARPESK